MMEGNTMTPCAEKGYKLGDYFTMADEHSGLFTKGETIQLVGDDGDDEPSFCDINGCDEYLHIDRVKPFNSPEAHVVRIDTRIARLEQELNTLHEQRREIINRNNLNK
ncbi:MAG: hypothetical protein ACRC8W_18685 [Plesiomonas shigelloides]